MYVLMYSTCVGVWVGVRGCGCVVGACVWVCAGCVCVGVCWVRVCAGCMCVGVCWVRVYGYMCGISFWRYIAS